MTLVPLPILPSDTGRDADEAPAPGADPSARDRRSPGQDLHRRDRSLRDRSRGRRRTHIGVRAPLWFLFPALALYAFIVVLPTLRGGFFAFTDWNGIASTWQFVGVDNFFQVWDDRRARASVVNTVILAAIVTIVQNVIALGLALALNNTLKSRSALRVVFFAPVVLTPLVAGYIWSYLLAPNGAVNAFLDGVGLHALSHDWLGDPSTALLSVCAAVIWQFSGYAMVIYLAGLQAIPEEILEAATIDGAGSWRRFVSVILPLLNGAILINVMLSLIGSLKQFDQVMAMTGGGPGTATETISTAILKNAFSSGDYPVSIALAVVMTVLIAVLAGVQYRLTARKVN
ncbi:sugar ABC transporter permease [Galbitalea sp. SE-J8]|uniref:carbohydrate ABC transporter permease n=1 Tax=Galbitalea sp. SE-J8 TaxID=3054952 RepID=UPI00259CFC62|nr:sugar ABC transporter permease [Galbitalea sp. SE-J8]MDM4762054.1 sugar ABC transporter permease [Galbitalea sp. SE-J8]